ncbi:hypothetical protein MTP10_40880 [Nonomuraea sp. 3-1Str]|uniref:hypothetical protein n=1 Tax=Nonomuraea sp. 3-1Str TaxID=2929801 RepID=UPI002860AD20|nr:hypothetical protein [Nonomuraea sp. 3-1Str]MDR8415073.1 hypothetical protein [Nonomuraea sp. 3-1Str]
MTTETAVFARLAAELDQAAAHLHPAEGTVEDLVDVDQESALDGDRARPRRPAGSPRSPALCAATRRPPPTNAHAARLAGL